MTKRAAAKRPAARTVSATIEAGDFAGWSATVRADFPTVVLTELQSGDATQLAAAFDRILVDHNMPDSDDQVAASAALVDPYDGMLEVLGAVLDKIGALPNR